MDLKTKSFWSGALGVVPLLVGVVPFGLIYGALARGAGLSTASAQAMSSIVFAGSAQFISTSLIRDATPGAIIVLTIAAVNLRHMLYSASVAPYIEHLPMRWKAVLSYLLTDEAYAVAITHYEKAGSTPTSHWFYLGAGLGLWTTWQLSSAAGIFLGAAIPASFPLDFALPLTFIAILLPVLKGRPMVAAALAAGLVALAANGLPYKLGLILAAAVGIAVGMLLEKRR
ncbi:MAG: AzlC family ABC transporter permease [Anaerolineae bacterium]